MNGAALLVRRLFSRRVAWLLCGSLALFGVAFSINAIGIQVTGDVSAWSRWLDGHRFGFLAWRMFLYGCTGVGWHWMRKRVRQREPAPDAQARLRRAEIAAACTIVILETIGLLHQPWPSDPSAP